jgi:hypothetical protein
MPTIKFSHHHPKIWGQKVAQLIHVQILTADYVQNNKALLQYDTLYITDLDVGYYQLPKQGKLIQLIFVGDNQIPFCTLRRYTTEKHRYYMANIKCIFEVVVENANH